MIDIKSRFVLKILIKECGNSYKIVEVGDIISAMPARYRVDSEGLEHILTYLERQDLISIKYDDEGVYCLCVLPYGFEVAEEENKKERDRQPRFFLVIFLSLVCAFVGAFLGAFLTKLL